MSTRGCVCATAAEPRHWDRDHTAHRVKTFSIWPFFQFCWSTVENVSYHWAFCHWPERTLSSSLLWSLSSMASACSLPTAEQACLDRMSHSQSQIFCLHLLLILFPPPGFYFRALLHCLPWSPASHPPAEVHHHSSWSHVTSFPSSPSSS